MGSDAVTDLEAYRSRRLGSAEARGATLIADARTAAAARHEAGRGSADEILTAARRAGEADADREADAQLAEARRDARRLVLEAQRDVFETFSRLSSDAVLALRERPDYGAMLDRLEARAVADLGKEVRITRDPPAAGGIIGEANDRRVIASLTAFADRCRQELGARIEDLWGPGTAPAQHPTTAVSARKAVR